MSVIADQGLFSPIIAYVLGQNLDVQAPIFFVANGLLSAISDNVFVATIYINEIKEALDSGIISRSQFDNLAIAINTGTNIPSIATTKWSGCISIFINVIAGSSNWSLLHENG